MATKDFYQMLFDEISLMEVPDILALLVMPLIGKCFFIGISVTSLGYGGQFLLLHPLWIWVTSLITIVPVVYPK